MTLLQGLSLYLIILSAWKGSFLLSHAETATTSANQQPPSRTCHPLTLKIDSRVDHRPHHLTIAHRGAAAHAPEHTLAGYRLALELGADFVEPDLLVTADRTLIAMHNMDLAVTTNVATKFPSRQPWFSPFANRTGYWVFNFTAAEIATLRVHQAEEEEGRASLYDGLFGVPTLTDIVQLVQEWNTIDLPKRLPAKDDDNDNESSESEGQQQGGGPVRPTALQLAQAGIYAELKDAVWIQQEVGLNVGDLLLQHLQQNPDPWETLLPCFDEVLYDDYKVPGLVIQSFDPQALVEFKQQWQAQQPLLPNVPEPPYVLLVDKEQCQDEEFWFKVGDSSTREMLSGIGCDKACLIAKEPWTLTTTRAEEYSLEIHAWTERPERTFVSDRFDSELDEIEYLYCHVGIQGVFSESVSTAVTAALLPCDKKKEHHKPSAQDEDLSQYCYDSAGEAGFFTGAAAFVMGVFIASLFFVGYGRHYVRWQSTAVPSADEGIIVTNNITRRTPEPIVVDDSSSHNMDEWRATAAAVDEWRSTQLASAAAVDEEEDQHGLELT